MIAQHLILFSFRFEELSVHVTKYLTPSEIFTLHVTLELMSIWLIFDNFCAPHVGRFNMKILIDIENTNVQEIEHIVLIVIQQMNHK